MKQLYKFTQKELTDLNKLVAKYFFEEFNIYFMHGLIASSICSGQNTDIPKLFFGKKAVVPMKQKLLNDPDMTNFFKLFQKFYEVTVDSFDNCEPFTPMINLTKLRRPDFTKDELTVDEQKNLLFWYLGYFYGYGTNWVHSKFSDYLDECKHKSNDDNMAEQYISAISIQVKVAYELLHKFNIELKDERFESVTDLITKLYKSFKENKITKKVVVAKNYSFCNDLTTLFKISTLVLSYKEVTIH